MTWLVTGGAGFIGSNLVLREVARGRRVVNLDTLSYAGNLSNLESLRTEKNHVFVKGDIADTELVTSLLEQYRPTAVLHLAAESHVDRSIADASSFVGTNVVGTYKLLDATLRWWRRQSEAERSSFRFLHVSTDEVYGSLGPTDPPFDERTPYAPNSPYAASKAASDHFARAYHHTHGLPVLVTHCSNNYGPLQFPEKLIPLMILNAAQRKPLPIYGDGLNVRDWLYVEDHAAALARVVERGRVGEVYDIGGRAEMTNLEVVTRLCDLVDELVDDGGPPRRGLMTFVRDRPGHDRRYAIDDTKLRTELDFAPQESFVTGLAKTVRWYLEHPAWVAGVQSGEYRRWLDTNYARRGESDEGAA
ncbi:MAG TPA: dTDP-glucose 4,6-dehydratase [Myxococcota bacterium]|nr:dTDP-glucose 4,6-dehydratase [Myxococcota bacterium]